jgi:inner membrane protein
MALIDRVGPLFLKTGTIGLLALLLLWPLARVQSLIEERRGLEQQAQQRISAAWGGVQWVAGPVLRLPMQRRVWVPYESASDRVERWLDAPDLQLLPAKLALDAKLDVSRRSSGIYSMPVYQVEVVASGEFRRADIQAWRARAVEGERFRPGPAVLLLPTLELSRVLAVSEFDVAGESHAVTAGTIGDVSALSVEIDLDAMLARGKSEVLPFRVRYTLAGSQGLRFLPTAREVQVASHGNWSAPRFEGAPAALSPKIDATGFTARWQALELNHGLPRNWRGAELDASRLAAAAFGFDLYVPVDVYSRNWRAVRYGVLFIALTFLCLFVWEHSRPGIQLHPMHYALVGLGLAIFYLMLLALSEHIGFLWAYGGSAVALILLICWYISGALGSWRPAATLGVVLAAAYAALYRVLDSEDYALLMGSAMVFAALATLMIATRRLDWTALGSQQGDARGANKP